MRLCSETLTDDALAPIRQAADRVRDIGHAHLLITKNGAVPVKTHALHGRLYLSANGWLMLTAPSSLVRGMFDALDEVGVELPPGRDGKINAHISVMRPEEIEKLGGPDKITERGHVFRYSLGDIKEVEPGGWKDISKVWYCSISSFELQNLRKSYGLSPLPNENKYEFHLTFAVRKKNVLQENAVTKVAVKQSNEESRSNADKGLRHLERNEDQMPEPEFFGLCELWRERNNGLRKMAEFLELLRGHGRLSGWDVSGKSRQLEGVLQRKLQMGDQNGAEAQYQEHQMDRLSREKSSSERSSQGVQSGSRSHNSAIEERLDGRESSHGQSRRGKEERTDHNLSWKKHVDGEMVQTSRSVAIDYCKEARQRNDSAFGCDAACVEHHKEQDAILERKDDDSGRMGERSWHLFLDDKQQARERLDSGGFSVSASVRRISDNLGYGKLSRQDNAICRILQDSRKIATLLGEQAEERDESGGGCLDASAGKTANRNYREDHSDNSGMGKKVENSHFNYSLAPPKRDESGGCSHDAFSSSWPNRDHLLIGDGLTKEAIGPAPARPAMYDPRGLPLPVPVSALAGSTLLGSLLAEQQNGPFTDALRGGLKGLGTGAGALGGAMLGNDLGQGESPWSAGIGAGAGGIAGFWAAQRLAKLLGLDRPAEKEPKSELEELFGKRGWDSLMRVQPLGSCNGESNRDAKVAAPPLLKSSATLPTGPPPGLRLLNLGRSSTG